MYSGVKAGIVPERGIGRLEQHAQVLAQPGGRELFGADAASFRNLDHPRATEQKIQRQRIDPARVVEKVPGSVDVRAGVRAHDEARHVRAGTLRDALDRLQLELRVAGVGGHSSDERHAHVQEFGHASHKPEMISPPRPAPVSARRFYPEKANAAGPFSLQHGFDLTPEVAYHRGDYLAST